MKIAGLQKVTLIDFPGRLAATVFLKGCNFRCPWCYNPELVLPEKTKQFYPVKSSKTGAPKGQFNGAGISKKEFFKFLKQRKGMLEGIVLCGGEPCINKGLPKFIKKIKKKGYLVKLDTNGSNPEMLAQLINKNLLDYVAMDIKGPKGKYVSNSGGKAEIQKIEQSIKFLKNSGINYEFRTTVVPKLHSKDDIVEIAKWISPASRYFLQNFRAEKTLDPKFEKIKPYSDKYMLEIQKAVAPFFETCQIR